jgi:RNA polymerase sigma-70 factor (ECF subfamily)
MTTVRENAPLDLADLVRCHQADVWRYLRFLGAPPGEADDLVQETFLSVLKKPLAQRCPQATAAYLRTVAKRQLLMARRRRGNRPNTVELDVADQVYGRQAGGQRWNDYLTALSDCLERTNGRMRQTLDLFYRDGQSREEIAHRLDMKPDGIKTLLRRARKSLRECVERKVKR